MKKYTKYLFCFLVTICSTSCNSCSNESDYVYDYRYIENVLDNNVNFKGSGTRSSCNISSHNCAFGIDRNNDGWCDNCWNNGYKCHMVHHQGR